ncbi:Transferase domain-containing protein [Cephalotus follicularis]|uniref:Transferase domain-containing protein n=1 Tax=Cephalotus follicularis TaxID=3775 RepID=A0A1Q3CGH9_CEPFO|nr:Transferase domain-containing protein [Cephalotus follicularis]
MDAKFKNSDNIISVTRLEPIIIQPETKISNGSYFLSNLDHATPVLMQTLYLYKLDGKRSGEGACDVMKKALAKVLVHYYPLAGRIRVGPDGKFSVLCTHEGVPFVEAVADCQVDVLGDIIAPDYAVLRKLVYVVPGAEDISEMPLMTAQVTTFKGEDFALGLTLHHLMADGMSAMEFVNSWAETARGLSLTTPPCLGRTLFKSRQPPKIDSSFENTFTGISDISNIEKLYQEEQIIIESFNFDVDKLARLKKLAMEDGALKACTSFTVLAALLWRARSKALNMKLNQKTKLIFTVDIRSKFKEPLPKGYFGNGVVATQCHCLAGDLIENPFSFGAKLVQNAIQGVNEEYVQSYIDYFEETKAMPSLNATLVITSWTRIPFENANFGWGEATQFGPVILPPEVAFFRPEGKDKKGIILVLGLPVSAMNTFKELMQI